MPHSAEQPLPEPSDDGERKIRPDLKLVPPLLEDGDLPDNPDLSEEALARAQGLEPIPAPSPEHHEAAPESLIDSPYLRAARDQLVSAWADLRKYEHGLIGAARGIVARKSRETVQASYDAASQAYQQALREQAQEVERKFGIIEKAKALVSAMEQMTDARAEVIIGKSELSRRMYQWWQKMGELNVGNVEAVKNILSRQEDDSAWKGKAKMVGRFIARGMSLRSAVGAAMVGSGFWFAYAGWRGASAAAGGAATHKLMREGMSVGSRELLAGSESKVRREYGEAELARMDDKELGELMQAYGARLGFHGEKLVGNARFERVRDAFLSRLQTVEENVEDREAEYEPEEEDVLEAVQARRDAMVNRLEELSTGVEEELAKKEKEDRRQRLIAAASALAVSGAIMYFRSGGIGGAEKTTPAPITAGVPVEETAPIEMSPKLMRDALHRPEAPAPAEALPVPPSAPDAEVAAVAPPVETPAVPVTPEAAAEAVAPAGIELPHGVAGVYEIKSGQGLLHAANEFQKSQHDAIVGGIKTQHPEWFAKGEDFAIRKWRLEQVRAHGGDITAAGEKYTETLHTGAKIQLEFDDKGYPHLTAIEDKNITHHAEQLRPRVEAVPKADLGFEKWGDNHPIRFSKEGVHGTMVPYGEGGSGEFVLDVRDIHVDDRALERFIDPNFKQALAERFKVGDDPAALAVLEEEAQKLGKELAARHAALEYLNEHGEVAPALRSELTRQIDETMQKAHWRFEDAQVFRPVSPAPEEVAQAAKATVATAPVEATHVTSVPATEADWEELKNITSPGKVEFSQNPLTMNLKELRLPDGWSETQQNAARRALEYNQLLVKNLETLVAEARGTPEFDRLNEFLKVSKEEALGHSKGVVGHIVNNDPREIPVVTDDRGSGYSIAETAQYDAYSAADAWHDQLRHVKEPEVAPEAPPPAPAPVAEAAPTAPAPVAEPVAPKIEVAAPKVEVTPPSDGVFDMEHANIKFSYNPDGTPKGATFDLSRNPEYGKFVMANRSAHLTSAAQDKLAILSSGSRGSFAVANLDKYLTTYARNKFAFAALQEAGKGNTAEAAFLANALEKIKAGTVRHLDMKFGDVIKE